MDSQAPILDYSTSQPRCLLIESSGDGVTVSYPPEPIWRPLAMISLLAIGMTLLGAVLVPLLTLARSAGGYSQLPTSSMLSIGGIFLGMGIKTLYLWSQIRRLKRALGGAPSRVIYLTSTALGGDPDPFEAERIVDVRVVAGPILASLRREYRLEVIDEEQVLHILLRAYSEQELSPYADRLREVLRLGSPSK